MQTENNRRRGAATARLQTRPTIQENGLYDNSEEDSTMAATAVEMIQNKDQERIDDVHLHLNDIFESLLRIPPGSHDGDMAKQEAVKALVKIRVQLSNLGLKHSEAGVKGGC
jgi:hypothetical protein